MRASPDPVCNSMLLELKTGVRKGGRKGIEAALIKTDVLDGFNEVFGWELTRVCAGCDE